MRTTWAGNGVLALGRVATRAKVGPAALLGLGIALFLLVPLSSAGNFDRVPPVVPAALALLVALSARHPALGLVILSALIPVSRWMGQGLELPAMRMAESLVLAVLSGALLGLGFDSCFRWIGPRAAFFIPRSGNGAAHPGAARAGEADPGAYRLIAAKPICFRSSRFFSRQPPPSTTTGPTSRLTQQRLRRRVSCSVQELAPARRRSEPREGVRPTAKITARERA